MSDLNKLGTETAFEVLARAQQLQSAGHPVINLGIGQPDFKTPEHICAAAIEAIRSGHHGYTDARGLLELRAAIAEDYNQSYGCELSPERVLVVPGGKMTMYLALSILARPGTSVVYPDPSFPIYASLINYLGATPIAYTLEEQHDFAPQADAILGSLRSDTSLVIVNSPGNPCGGVISKEQIDKLAAGLAQHPRTYLLSDEIYERIFFPGAQHYSFLSYPELAEQLILLSGCSKSWAMTGWRLGYSIWPEQLYSSAQRLNINTFSCVNASAQYAAIAALRGEQDCVSAMCAAFARRSDYLHQALNSITGISCARPQGAFYLFPNVSGLGLSAKQAQELLLEKYHLATIAGTSFGAAGEGHIRLSSAASDEQLQEAVERIELAVAGL